VQRNRLKRRLRELARLRLLRTLPAVDVVIRTRREAYAATFEALAADVDRVGSELPRLFAR
jgi:ribonuclease P protein component